MFHRRLSTVIFTHTFLESEKDQISSEQQQPPCQNASAEDSASRRATRRTGHQSGRLATENSSYQLTLTHQNWTTEDLEMN